MCIYTIWCFYIHIYVYVYIFTYPYTHTCASMYSYVHICIHTYVHLYIYLHIFIYICLYMCVCMRIRHICMLAHSYGTYNDNSNTLKHNMKRAGVSQRSRSWLLSTQASPCRCAGFFCVMTCVFAPNMPNFQIKSPPLIKSQKQNRKLDAPPVFCLGIYLKEGLLWEGALYKHMSYLYIYMSYLYIYESSICIWVIYI